MTRDWSDEELNDVRFPAASPADGPIGLIGLGNMGTPMSARLVGAGYEVRGHDAVAKNAAAAEEIGVLIETSAEAVAARCEVILFVLPGSDVVDDVATQIASLDPDARRCRMIVDMSSSSPTRTQALASRLETRRLILVDAPVSGGVTGAEQGTLTIMAGGSMAAIESLAPVFRPLGARVVRVGEVGAGHAVKALNNLLSATHLLATNEAVIAAARFGLSPELLLSVVNTSSGRSGSTERKLPDFVLTGTFASGFSAALMEKDVGIATALARELGVEVPIMESVLARWHELGRELGNGADHTEIIKPLERRHSVEIRGNAMRGVVGRRSA